MAESSKAWGDRMEKEQRERDDAATKPYLDPSLAMAIQARLGPGFEHAYRPDRKHFIRTPFPTDVRGLYALVDRPQERPLNYPYKETEEGEVYTDLLRPKQDHIYNFGTKPSAKTLAHEYRHRAGVTDEYDNRLYDAMYANTPEDWEDAVELWRDQRRKDIGVLLSRDEAEAHLVQRISEMRPKLMREQYDAAPENSKPVLSEEPSIVGWLMDMLREPRENWAQRTSLPYEKLNVKPKPKESK